jgi:hypothetical protein
MGFGGYSPGAGSSQEAGIMDPRTGNEAFGQDGLL